MIKARDIYIHEQIITKASDNQRTMILVATISLIIFFPLPQLFFLLCCLLFSYLKGLNQKTCFLKVDVSAILRPPCGHFGYCRQCGIAVQLWVGCIFFNEFTINFCFRLVFSRFLYIFFLFADDIK